MQRITRIGVIYFFHWPKTVLNRESRFGNIHNPLSGFRYSVIPIKFTFFLLECHIYARHDIHGDSNFSRNRNLKLCGNLTHRLTSSVFPCMQMIVYCIPKKTCPISRAKSAQCGLALDFKNHNWIKSEIPFFILLAYFLRSLKYIFL